MRDGLSFCMIYNPTTHTLHFDNGELFATLESSVSSQTAFNFEQFADKDYEKEIDKLKRELKDAENEYFELENHGSDEMEELKDELSELKQGIRDLYNML